MDILTKAPRIQPVQPSPRPDPDSPGLAAFDEDQYAKDIITFVTEEKKWEHWEQRDAAFLLLLQSRIKGRWVAGIFHRHTIVSLAYIEFLASHASANAWANFVAYAELPLLKLNGITPADIMDYVRRVEAHGEMIVSGPDELDDLCITQLLVKEIGTRFPCFQRTFLDDKDRSLPRLLRLLRK